MRFLAQRSVSASQWGLEQLNRDLKRIIAWSLHDVFEIFNWYLTTFNILPELLVCYAAYPKHGNVTSFHFPVPTMSNKSHFEVYQKESSMNCFELNWLVCLTTELDVQYCFAIPQLYPCMVKYNWVTYWQWLNGRWRYNQD